MVVDFNQPLTYLDGSVLILNGKESTLKYTSVFVLEHLEPNQRLDGVEKLKRGILAEKIYLSEEPIEITLEQAALIKKLIGDVLPPPFVRAAWKILEQENSNGSKA